MALALRGRSDEKLGRAVLVDAQPRRLAAAETGRLDAARDPHADEPAIPGSIDRDLAQLLQRQLEQSRVVAAVVDEAVASRRIAGGVWNLLRLHHVAAAQLGGLNLQRARQPVHHTFHRVVAERPASAADEPARNRVGVDELRLDVHRRQHVGREHVRDDDVRLAGARARVRAEVVQQLSAKAAQLAGPVRRDLDLDDRSVRLRGRRAVFAA